MITGTRVRGRASAIIASAASWLKALKEVLPRLFSSRVEMRVIRIELASRPSVAAIFFLQAALEVSELRTYYLDMDRSKMKLYADVFIKNEAEKLRAEILVERLRREGKVSKRLSLN